MFKPTPRNFARIVVPLCVLPLALFLVTAVSAAAGDPDSSFDGDGRVVTDLGGSDRAFSVAVQRDGKIVVAGESAQGNTSKFALARYNPDGSLDGGFGSGGKVLTATAGGAPLYGINAAAIQPDGKIVAAGYAGGVRRGFDFAVARYNVDGTLDTAFGAGGATTTDFFSWRDFPSAVAVQPDGKIVVTGDVSTLAERERGQFGLARYNADGSLDGSFDGDGKVVTEFGPGSDDRARDLVVQPDGKIVVAGAGTAAGTDDVAVARYNADGSLDPTFDVDGRVLTSIEPGRHESAWALALQADGKLVAAGGFGLRHSVFVLVRYRSNGSLDPTFAGDGVLDVYRTAPAAWDVAIQRDGRIVVVGGGGVIHRFTDDGRVDATFGGGRGMVEVDFGPSEALWSAALQSDGKIVAAGQVSQGTDVWDFGVARLLAHNPTCLVPNVRGRTLAVARRALLGARCTLGRVARQRSSVRKGLVLSQRPAPGTVLPEGGAVRLVISLGRRR